MRRVGHVAQMEEVRHAYIILSECLKETDHFEYLSVDEW
jgi:hypothetical protein